MTRSLEGQVALVTGTSRGIGRAAALELEAQGAIVASIQRGDGVGHSLTADLGDADAAAAAVSEVIKGLGRLDICVYAAGINHREAALEVSVADWKRVIDVNLTGAFVVTQAAAKQFVAQGPGGRIVHVASELSFFGGVGVSAYAASKGGIAQLAKSQSNEWAHLGVRVNAVVPGWIETDMTQPLRDDGARAREITERIPAGRWGDVAEVAAAIAWMVSPACSYMSGASVVIDGGYMVR